MKQCSHCKVEYPDAATTCADDGTPLDESPEKAAVSGWDQLWLLYLIVCSVMSIFAVGLYIAQWQHMNDTLPAWDLIILRCAVFLRPLTLFAIWAGCRLGVVGYLLLSFISICVCLVLGLNFSLTGIIGILIMVAFVRPRWAKMSWEPPTLKRRT